MHKISIFILCVKIMREKTRRTSNLDKIFEKRSKRTFLFMKTIDLYIFREYMVIYSCCILAFCTLFQISDMINNLGDFLGHSTVWEGMHYFLLKQPGNVRFILPISLLLACLYTMAKMGMSNEITAMRSSGISLTRCGMSMYLIGFLVTGVNFWFNASFVPNCNMKAEILLKSIGDPDYFKKMTKMLMYRSPDNLRTWIVKEFENENELKNIQIKKNDIQGNMILELYADKGTWYPNEGWKFYNTSIVNYKTISLVNDYTTDQKTDKDVNTKNFIVPISKKFALLDEANPSFKDLGDVVEIPDDLVTTRKTPDQVTTTDILRRLEISKELDPVSKNTLKTELYSRYAFPWVCLFAVMIGLPIAGRNARRGVVTSIMSAVSVVVIYMVLSQIFVVLGNKGFIPTFIAGVLPTMGLGIYAIILINKNK